MANLSILELAKRTYGGSVLRMAEVLSQTNELFLDAAWIPGNGTSGHVFPRRTSLPSGTWRKINEGVASQASTSRQVTEPFSFLEARSVVDKKLVDMASDRREFRATEDDAFLEGMLQTFCTGFVYGDPTAHPERIQGVNVRIASLSASNFVTAGGTGGDQTSILVVEWGPRQVCFAYPKGTTLGLKMDDLGEIDALDGSSNAFRAYATLFDIDAALVVHDDRCLQRIGNVDTGTLSTTLHQELITAVNRLPRGGVNAAIYCNETIRTQLDIIAADKSNVYWQPREFGGRRVTAFRGEVPVRRLDALLNTEAQVT